MASGGFTRSCSNCKLPVTSSINVHSSSHDQMTQKRPIPKADQRGALIALERYFTRAVVMCRDYWRAGSEVAKLAVKREPIEKLRPAALEQDAYFHLWLGSLKVVIDGWKERLEYHDPEIDDLVSGGFDQLFKQFRNVVFHFEPEYLDEPFSYTGEQGLTWLEDLMHAFADFFHSELGTDSQLASIAGWESVCGRPTE